MTKDEVLAKQRTNMALAAAENEAGTVMIGDTIINSTIHMNEPGIPALTDNLFIVKQNADGSKEYVKYTVQSLLEALGQDVTNMKNQVATMTEHVDSVKESIDASVETISGYPELIESQKNEALSEIGSAGDSELSQIGAAGDSELQQIGNAGDSALSEIGTAKTGALSEIGTSKESALSDIEDQKDAAIEELKGNLHVGYSTTIGDGTTTEFTIIHNLGSEWTIPFVLFADPEKAYYHKYFDVDQNTARIVFDFPPDPDGVEVRIIPNVRVEVADLPATMTISRNNLDEDTECTAEDVQELIAILD